MSGVTGDWQALAPEVKRQLDTYADLMLSWNQRVNLVSRRTRRSELVERHIAHSLTLNARRFAAGSRVVDWGTGGGLPGLVLAIVQPEVEFVLVDSIRKKTLAVQAMASELSLDNVTVWNGRAESWSGSAHYAVSRATAPLRDLWAWTEPVLTPIDAREGTWPSGLLALKGGDLDTEAGDLAHQYPSVEIVLHPLGAPFEDKKLVVVTPG